IVVWHYHDDGVPGPDAAVELTIKGLSSSTHDVRVTHYRIDDEHSNAYTAWRKLGSPQEPSMDERAALEKASELTKLDEHQKVESHDGTLALRVTMPRQSVSLLRLEW
ncbi:MAG TPA: hypothetical protein VKB78_05045, partial [Pirellulales bacterium]|nr:hypothetical protein [Pirellulales bacterium]